jgi:MFS family permease
MIWPGPIQFSLLSILIYIHSWNLGASIIVTIGGRLSDIAGRRWFLLFGAIAGAVGALVGATGQSITQMIISGIIFGVGGGFQEMCFACAQELVPNKDRFKTLGKFERK